MYDELNAFLDLRGVRHFTAEEICPARMPLRQLWTNIVPTLHFAELLRAEFGPTTVRSGYRDPVHNARVGGAPKSLHLSFNALDLAPERGDQLDWANFMAYLSLDKLGGLGTYDGFIHIDTRLLVFGRTPWRG